MKVFSKFREAVYMIIHRKNFKKVSIDILQENKRYEDVLRYENDLLKDQNEKLKEKFDITTNLAVTLVDENKALKKR